MSPGLQKILSDLSWASKVRLLEQYFLIPNSNPVNWSKEALLHKRPSVLRSPVNPGARTFRRFERQVGMEALRQPVKPAPLSDFRRQSIDPHIDHITEATPELVVLTEDEKNMKLKLFRLMYETVRDSDLKVKRAELIKSHYTNSSAFEVGYLLGEVTDKFNVMTDIAATLRRLYNEWRPIEHINAYEQIANQAIEINHLIDIVRTVHKREAKHHPKEQKSADKPEKLDPGDKSRH